MITTAYVSEHRVDANGSFTYASPIHTPVTFVISDNGEHFNLKMLNHDSGDVFDDVDIPKPSFLSVDEHNWAQYIDYTITTQGTSVEHGKHKYKKLILGNGVTLMSRRSIGLITFQLNPHEHKSYRITTIEKTPYFEGSRVIVPYKVFDSKFEMSINYIHISVDLDGLIFRPVNADISAVGEAYKLPFTEALNINTLYLASHHKGPLTKSQIWKLTQNQKGQSANDQYAMVWKSIGKFDYLESSDGKFKITFHDKLEEPIVNLIRESLLVAYPLDEIDGLCESMSHTNSNDSLTSVFRFVEQIQSQ